MTVIKAPSDFTGPSVYGPITLTFDKGRAEYEGDLPDGLRAYLESAGYGIGSGKPTPPAEAEVPDPREVGIVTETSPLRDAAVDPSDVDFLPPVNAGAENPHGPLVVAPGIHGANMPKPIHPGPVGASGDLSTPDRDADPNVVKDTDKQAENESRLAQAVLVDRQPVPAATADAAKVDPVGTDAGAKLGVSPRKAAAKAKADAQNADDEAKAAADAARSSSPRRK